MTPVKNKIYQEHNNVLDNIWAGASDSLDNAERIIVAGYSFPTTDDRVRDLVLSALKRRPGEIDLLIVDPDANGILSRFDTRNLEFARSIDPLNETVESYIYRISKTVPAEMKRFCEGNEEVFNWVKKLHAMYRLNGGDTEDLAL